MIDAPFRLPTESYQTFSRLLPGLEQDSENCKNVDEELRKLDIDPKLFYRNQNRLFLSQPPPDLDCEELKAEIQSEDDWILIQKALERDNQIFSPPSRVENGPGAASSSGELNLTDEVRCEEITLAKEGETVGGRLGRETPEGLSSRLQIDQLTDDGDETTFRQDLSGYNDQDLVEAFTLDPDFDYDNAEGLSSRVEPHVSQTFCSAFARLDHESESEDAEDAVAEP